MFRRIKAVSKKEVKHLLRDWRMLGVIVLFPVFLLGVFGYAVNFDVENINIALLDHSKSKESREFISSLTSSSYFNTPLYLTSDQQVKEALDTKKAQAIIIIPASFSNDLIAHNKTASIQFLIDGVDGNTASIIKGYLEAAESKYNLKVMEAKAASFGLEVKPIVNIVPRFWFNPNLQSTQFLIPGLIAMILIVTSVITVSLSLVREKERGTMEQVKVSSISTIELLLGKSLPYIILALLNAVFILIAGYILFDVVIKGNYITLLITTLIFIFASVSLGIFISSAASSQQVAFTAATFASLLPSVILSGFIFPIESMPVAIQVITNLTPAKFYLVALRAIILKGVGFQAFWDQLLYLMMFALFFLVMANKVSKNQEAKG